MQREWSRHSLRMINDANGQSRGPVSNSAMIVERNHVSTKGLSKHNLNSFNQV